MREIMIGAVAALLLTGGVSRADEKKPGIVQNLAGTVGSVAGSTAGAAAGPVAGAAGGIVGGYIGKGAGGLVSKVFGGGKKDKKKDDAPALTVAATDAATPAAAHVPEPKVLDLPAASPAAPPVLALPDAPKG
ncbi:hypothetical protein P7B02_07385 [Caulobacter segnis]|uniref:hypothetical protein n=1 Tax=Caulobacter segnis TaxID=88688 RepID=UPI00240EDF51|nr:hypothetical protein [Caulobacter segnis]MDG2521360.1 hypothetical protein [Caulobacter segnis]